MARLSRSMVYALNVLLTGRLYDAETVATSVGWSTSYARDVLNRLVKKRLVRKVRKGNRVYYQLAVPRHMAVSLIKGAG